MRAKKGILIAVEGIDGCGKSTQIQLIQRWLELSGIKVFSTAWDSSNIIGNAIRKGKRENLLTPTTFSLIHATDFTDRYERQIWPLLQAGYIVLCDRYIYTAFARDAVRGCDPGWVRKLYSFAASPDITFFLQISLQTAVQRAPEVMPRLDFLEAGGDLHLDEDPQRGFMIYQQKLQAEYGRMVDEYDFAKIGGDRSIEEVQEEMREVIASRVELGHYQWGLQ